MKTKAGLSLFTLSLSALVLAALLTTICPITLSAQSYMYAINGDCCTGHVGRQNNPPYIYQIDLATGNVVTITLPQGIPGEGIAKVGSVLYYTYYETRNVYMWDLNSPGEQLAFTVPGSQYLSLASLAYDGSNSLWVQEYPLFYGYTTNTVYKCTLPSGPCGTQITMANCSGNGCDGLEYFQIPGIFAGQPSLIANEGSETGPYDVVDLNGNIRQRNYINPGSVGSSYPTGIAWDGTYFYTADARNNGTIYKWDKSGVAKGSITLTGYPPDQTPFLHDLAVDFPAPTVCVPPPNTTMVAWYPFDELTGTTSANLATGNTGTQYHGPLGNANGEVAGAATFNGTNQYVESPSSIATNFGPANDAAFCSSTGTPNKEGGYSTCRGNFSIDTWVKVGPSSSPGAMTIVDKRSGHIGALYGYTLFAYNGTVGLQLADGGYTNYFSPTLTPAINDGNWHHIAVTIDRLSSVGITWYHNGTSIGNADPTGHSLSLANNSPLRIGTRTAANPLTGWFSGALDELEIYNRVLSPQELLDIYNAGNSGKCKP